MWPGEKTMQKENLSEESNTETQETVQQSEGLSLRDALEVALEAEKEEVPAPEEAEQEAVQEEKKPELPPLEPPAEWEKEDKELFHQSTRAQQEASLKLHHKRAAKLEEIKREAADLQWAKDLAKEVEPYLKAVGEKIPTHEALIKALKLRNELDSGDPKANAAAYLRSKGLPVPKDLLEAEEEGKKEDPVISELRRELEAIKSERVQKQTEQTVNVLSQHWQTFEQEKNAAGTPRYPDLANTEKGLELASNIGSLVRGDSDLSKQFIANAKARIPNLTYSKLLEEAYKFYGGTVDESTAPRTQDTQRHIVKSRRAASSVPGRGAQSASGTVKKYKSYREAAAAALASLNE